MHPHARTTPKGRCGTEIIGDIITDLEPVPSRPSTPTADQAAQTYALPDAVILCDGVRVRKWLGLGKPVREV